MNNELNRLLSVTAAGDKIDSITMDVPLFMRLMELSRETLKTDIQLHLVVEKVITAAHHKDVLTMADYDSLCIHGVGDSADEKKMAENGEDDY